MLARSSPDFTHAAPIRGGLLLTLLVLAAPSAARADCQVSPPPPAPQTCDPGGGAGDGTACDFTSFTYGSWVSVGVGGTSAATGEARRTVFEGQASSTISSCAVTNPQNAGQTLFDADAHADATNEAFEVGVHVRDVVPGRGDPFQGTLEAANARVAAAIDFGTLQPTDDLDAVLHIDGGFGGSGRAKVQLGVRDFVGNTLAALFAASESPPTNPIVWRVLDCPDPRSGCGSFVDHTSSWPGVYDLPLKIPAIPGNGIWIELKGEAPLDADAGAGATLSVDFENTASLELLPPPGVTVTLATGQGTSPPEGAGFDVSTLFEGSVVDEKRAGGVGDQVITLVASGDSTTMIARGTSGSARLLGTTDAPDPIGYVQGQAGVGWNDRITPSGAEVYRFEVELSGLAAMGEPPVPVNPGEGEPILEQGWFASVGIDDGQFMSSGLVGTYLAKHPDSTCPQGSLEVENACFTVEPTESAAFPASVVGSGELGDGPVVLRFEPMLADGVPVDLRVGASVSQDLSAFPPIGPIQMTLDLGTEQGRYARFLGITAAFTGGVPDETWSIVSEGSYDYSQPGPLAQPIPEPGVTASALGALTALAACGAARRRRD